jgi:hypothetical protein
MELTNERIGRPRVPKSDDVVEILDLFQSAVNGTMLEDLSNPYSTPIIIQSDPYRNEFKLS